MQFSLSVRVAEAPTKDHLTMPLDQLAGLARRIGYSAICMRASAVSVHMPHRQWHAARQVLDDLGLSVSMATTDVEVPLNNDRGPNNLRNIGPHLDLAEALGTDLIRICLKREVDLIAAQRAADEAADRGIRLAHQCHTDSLCETLDAIEIACQAIHRPNFGIIYEPANLMLCGEPYDLRALERLRPWLMNVYVQNHRLGDDGPVSLPTRVRGPVHFHDIPLWSADGVNFAAVFEGLRAIDYEGTITVHQAFGSLMEPKVAAEKSFRFLSGLAASDTPTS